MMISQDSDFNPLDLLGTLGVNAAATHRACQDGSLRTGFKVGDKKEVEAYTDYRFLAGVGAAVAAQFGPPVARRVGHDLATGLLGSFVATETARMVAQTKVGGLGEAGMADDSQNKQIPSDMSARDQRRKERQAQAVPAGAQNRGRGSLNTAYGW